MWIELCNDYLMKCWGLHIDRFLAGWSENWLLVIWSWTISSDWANFVYISWFEPPQKQWQFSRIITLYIFAIYSIIHQFIHSSHQTIVSSVCKSPLFVIVKHRHLPNDSRISLKSWKENILYFELKSTDEEETVQISCHSFCLRIDKLQIEIPEFNLS